MHMKKEETNMKLGTIDMDMVSDKYEYLIVYSEPDEPKVVKTWALPAGNFQINYESMVARGAIIHNVFKRMNPNELLSEAHMED